jgi:hypothetical protein
MVDLSPALNEMPTNERLPLGAYSMTPPEQARRLDVVPAEMLSVAFQQGSRHVVRKGPVPTAHPLVSPHARSAGNRHARPAARMEAPG